MARQPCMIYQHVRHTHTTDTNHLDYALLDGLHLPCSLCPSELILVSCEFKRAPGSEMFDSSCHVLAGFVHGE